MRPRHRGAGGQRIDEIEHALEAREQAEIDEPHEGSPQPLRQNGRQRHRVRQYHDALAGHAERREEFAPGLTQYDQAMRAAQRLQCGRTRRRGKLCPVVAITAAVRVHDQPCALSERQTRQQHLAHAARVAREVDMHDVGTFAQVGDRPHDRLDEGHDLAPLRALDHRRELRHLDIRRQRADQRALDSRDAAAHLQIRAEH